MLARKQYARHAIQNKAITIFLLSLVLISSFAIAEAEVQPTQEPRPQGDFLFSANSVIPIGKTGLTWVVRPDGRLRWYLRNPSNEIAYYQDVGEIYETEPGKGYIDDPDIRVPFNPQQGLWKLELVVKGPWFGIIENTIISYPFNVGESSLMDNLMAPVYVTWGGIVAVKWGEFSWALPGIFWITSPFWIFAIFFILLALYKRSIRLAIALIRESGKRFREALA